MPSPLARSYLRRAALRRTLLSSLAAVALAAAVIPTAVLPAAVAAPARAAGPARLAVVASFYPLAEWAAVVGDDRVEVHNLTPAGAEPHDLEPTPSDLRRLRQADVVITLGAGFQPAIDRALAGRPGRQIRVVATEGLPLRPGAGDLESGNHDHAAKAARTAGAAGASGGHGPGRRGSPPAPEPASGGQHDHGEGLAQDPHVWLDPVLAKQIVQRIAAALAGADPAGKPTYEANAQAYAARLDALHRAYERTLATCKRRELVTAHAAFGYLAARYGLEQVPISGLSPEAEPTPGRLAELIDFVRTHGVTAVFFETLASPKVAETVARETGARTMVLNPLEGLTPVELAQGKDYLGIMEENLRSLAAGLECRLP